MTDPWLLAAICLIILSVFAVMRVMARPERDDRFVGLNAAITIAAAASLALSISWGNLAVLDMFIMLVGLCYAGTLAIARSKKGDKA